MQTGSSSTERTTVNTGTIRFQLPETDGQFADRDRGIDRGMKGRLVVPSAFLCGVGHDAAYVPRKLGRRRTP